MSGVQHVDDIVVCKLCSALTTYADRAKHVEWHARLNARTHTNQTAERPDRYDGEGK